IVNLTDRNTNTATYIEEELAGKPLEELEELHNELPILINKLNEQYRLSIEHTKALERNGVVEKELNRLGIHLETEKKTYDRLATEKAEAEKNLIDLRQLVELQIRIQNYDADRQQLELEKPCLLCGSLHHPYKANNYHSAVSAAEQKRNELQIKFNQLNNFLSEASIAINTLTNQIAVLNEEVTRITAAINDHALSFKTNNIDLLPMLSVDDSEQIQLLVSEYRHNHQLLQKKIKTIKDLQKTVAEINTGLSIKQRELLTEENKITLTKEQLKNIAVEKKRLIQEHEITFEKIRTTMISATNFLLKYNIRLDVKGFADAEVALQERSNFYQNSLHQLQTNKLAEATLQTESEHLANKIKDLLEHETSLQAIVEQERSFVDEKATERKNIFGEKDPSAERKRMNEALQQFARRMEEMDLALNDKQEMIKVLEGKVEEWRRSLQRALDEFEKLTSILLSKLKAEGIDDIDELVSNILPDNEAQSIHTIQQAINTNIATNTGILNSTVEEYNREIVKNLTTEQTEALQEISVNQEKLISELNQQIGGLQKVLEKDIDDANKYHQIAGLAAVQEKEFARWNKLCSLIGSADGKKFSRFAQGLTLARLTELANRHLKKFSDRYQILKSIEKDLELQIIDAYQADVVRPMNTLSGGESFLVSLSLALGLSDLAGRKVQIQSLFIDEGFGTLDAETLDVAISALENLQVSGKMIGIISHVEALKERIGTQIEVSKQQGGYSQIAIRSYGKPVMNI
ncbi:MAG: SbcC/MukB-like Walker B domain-containing protein, partial [Ferruginibacter sp.]